MEILDRIEESGLDKLIKLLTEHCRKHYGFKDYDDIEIDTDSVNFYLYHNGKKLFNIGVEKVIFKDFGFIKWLVENDKIDLDKLKENITFTSIGVCFDLRTIKEGESIIIAIGTNTIIAYLSIQDNPIEFLVSILK